MALTYLGFVFFFMSALRRVEVIVRVLGTMLLLTVVYIPVLWRQATPPVGRQEPPGHAPVTLDRPPQRPAAEEELVVADVPENVTPTPAALRARKEVNQAVADLKLLQQSFQDLSAAMLATMTIAAEESRRMRDSVATSSQRFQDENTALGSKLQAAIRAFAETPSITYEVRPAPPVEPGLLAGAQRYLHVLRANGDYRDSILTLVNASALVDDVGAHLASLYRQSTDLYALSVVIRGGTSPRMQAWAKDNAEALNSLLGVRPLLQRLRRLTDLDGTEESTERFLRGMHERELTAMGLFLVHNPLSTEQQVKMALRLAAQAMIRQWLAPTIRLYQLIHEALRVEDADIRAAMPGPRSGSTDGTDPGYPVDTFRTAATTLGYRYVHHELYSSVDPYTMPADISPGTPRYTFAQWISGEANEASRHLVLAKDCLGRVTVPRFEEANSRGTIETQIVIIKGEG